MHTIREESEIIETNKREELLLEEDKLQRTYLIRLLADLIRLHYKYYKNEEFDTFEQYLNGYNTLYLTESKEEKVKLYREIDDVLLNKYELFFAHYILDKPIHLISVAQERLEE